MIWIWVRLFMCVLIIGRMGRKALLSSFVWLREIKTLYLDKLSPEEFMDFLKNQLSTVLDFIKQDVTKNKE